MSKVSRVSMLMLQIIKKKIKCSIWTFFRLKSKYFLQLCFGAPMAILDFAPRSTVIRFLRFPMCSSNLEKTHSFIVQSKYHFVLILNVYLNGTNFNYYIPTRIVM